MKIIKFRSPKRLAEQRSIGKQSRADAKKAINMGNRMVYMIDDDGSSDGDKVHFKLNSDMEPVRKKKEYYDWTPHREIRLTHNSIKVKLTPHMDEEYEEGRRSPVRRKARTDRR